MSAFSPPGDCPNCGEPVPAGAAACPHCGADERTGWSDETYLDGVDLPGGDDEEAEPRRAAGGRGRWWIGLVALLLILALAGLWLRG